MSDSPMGTDINQVRPTSLSHIRGQPRVVEQLQLHLAAHFNMRWTAASPPEFGPVILCGPPGVGKTLVAQALHAELGNLKFLSTNGVTLNKKPELYSVLVHADAETTLFIDEAQGLKSQAQYVLLAALSEKTVQVPGLASSTNPYAIPLAPFTMILATTHEYLLQEALRDRMRIQCRFDYYSVEDLVEDRTATSGCPRLAVRVRGSLADGCPTSESHTAPGPAPQPANMLGGRREPRSQCHHAGRCPRGLPSSPG